MKEVRIEPYLSPNYYGGEFLDHYDLSISHGDISFEVFEITTEEVKQFIQDIQEQLDLVLENPADRGLLRSQ